ncbi:hypothetical protein BH09MYX1_BH09MYX1_42640 [soil metagenome]
MSSNVAFVIGLLGSLGSVLVLWRLFRFIALSVEDEETVLVTSFGKLSQTLGEPGLHVVPSLIFPWVSTRRVSRQRDFREIDNVHVNDATGTTIIVDLWLEFRIADAEKAAFSVQDWDRSLRNVTSHAALSILSNKDFVHILTDRNELADNLKHDIKSECERWGLVVENVFIRNVRLLPEVGRLMFETVAARLERAKARVEEEGRLAVAMLDAETAASVAKLVADAKAQYPLAMGHVFTSMKTSAKVCAAYNELYELAQLRPHRTIAFVGFDGMRAADAAMMVPDLSSAPRPELPEGATATTTTNGAAKSHR